MLDVETAARLDRLAEEWQVSKSEALRRLIKSAGMVAAPDRVTMFRQLQQAMKLTASKAETWAAAVRAERRATDGRRATRRR